MLVTELGMVTDVKFSHSSKAYLPMFVTDAGMVIDVISLHPKNDKSAMPVTVNVLPAVTFSGIISADMSEHLL